MEPTTSPRLMSMEIQTFHKYNRLVARGLTKPLACSHCGTEYILRATEDGDPVLWCIGCPATVQPGLAMYENILSVVKEHMK